ncbi:uncharacterized protein LOC113125322 [Mastacembelus armatus]|uniref:uncharacterized protein LOC113125322 n=1 Tax=Mastacembelus armatus TaxID=205130 RepID=UPI000E45EA6C|nr:uncharacterized protein LOC113125322 [Mastacembelus armatus]
MMSLSLMLLLLLVCSSQADYFMGTVMTYYPKNTNANGSVTVILRYKSQYQACVYKTWNCLNVNFNCGTENSLTALRVSEEKDESWCQAEVTSTRLVPSNAQFQLRLDGVNWINNIVNGIVSAKAVTVVELRNRSDTGRANRSPQTTILPSVRVPSNCQRDFSLLAFDPDGDQVTCRYGNTSLSECDPCTPPSVLSLSSSCTLSFSPTISSQEGPYAVQLVMEDFPRQTITLTQTNGLQTLKTTSDAISKIPIQFVLRVEPVVPSCTEGLYLPKFLPPTPDNRARLYTSVNQTVEIRIKAEANISTISKVMFSGPYKIFNSTMGPGYFSLKWTPSQREDGESHPICFVVTAVHNGASYQSDLRCVIVSVVDRVVLSTPEGLYLPWFLPPTPDNRARLYTGVNQTVEIRIIAETYISTISKLMFSGPYNIIKDTMGPGYFSLKWTPFQKEDGESHPICFVVTAVHNGASYQSDQRCVIVSVVQNTGSSLQLTLTHLPIPWVGSTCSWRAIVLLVFQLVLPFQLLD